MAINTASVVISTDTFNDLVTKLNNVVSIIANSAVTANSTLSVTTGNALLNGSFTSNTLYIANTVAGGNSSTSANLNLASPLQQNVAQIMSNVVSFTSNATNQTVDSFAVTALRSAKYLLQINTVYGYQLTELLLLQDGTNVDVTEYATMTSNGVQGSFSTALVSNTVSLLITPVQNTFTVSFNRISLNV